MHLRAFLMLGWLALAICARAGSDFHISVVSPFQGGNLALRGADASTPVIFASSKPLPFTASEAQISAIDPNICFYVEVENTKDTPVRIEMFESDWYACLSFAIKIGDKVAQITRREHNWKRNTNWAYVFPPHGVRIIAVDFSGGGWSGIPKAIGPFEEASASEKATLTVTFRYNPTFNFNAGIPMGDWRTASSDPIPVLFKSD